ncbi:hypothetical protein BH11GEM2_BH11GEM2_15360 [soil metagenome]
MWTARRGRVRASRWTCRSRDAGLWNLSRDSRLRRYGAYREEEGTSERALFVINGTGTIRWSYKSPIGVNPGVDGILEALESMNGAQP